MAVGTGAGVSPKRACGSDGLSTRTHLPAGPLWLVGLDIQLEEHRVAAVALDRHLNLVDRPWPTSVCSAGSCKQTVRISIPIRLGSMADSCMHDSSSSAHPAGLDQVQVGELPHFGPTRAHVVRQGLELL
eukprot:SAG22_NODE_97_length_20760_cov_43.302850_11_plen_130_part_00